MAVRASRLAADSLRVLPRKRLSRLVGRVADLPGPPALIRAAVDAYVRILGVDLTDAVVPDGGYRSFQEFFTRRLREGARPIDPDEGAIVSPADGRLDDLGAIDPQAALLVKGKRYRAGELLGGDDERFRGGSYFIVYLSPRDYHRVHAPVAGRVLETRHVPGTLFPVNAIGVEHIAQLFAKNERVAVLQEHGDDAVATVLVGAMNVGRITLAFDDVRTNDGQPGGVRRYDGGAPILARGEELGVFNLGSTVIVFIPARQEVEFVVEPGDHVRMGQAVARVVSG